MVSYALFLDDERFPDQLDSKIPLIDWKIARNYFDAVWMIENIGMPYHISFDHDLGSPSNPTGMDFAKYLGNFIMDRNLKVDFSYYVHSMNPVGAKNIQSYMDQLKRDL